MTAAVETALAASEAVDQFLAHVEEHRADKTLRNYRHRLDTFLEWADDRGGETVDDLDAAAVEDYREFLEGRDGSPLTVKGKMSAFRQLLVYCAERGVVDDELPEQVTLPRVANDSVDVDDRLDAAAARPLVSFYRGSVRHYGTAQHLTLELVWNIGASIQHLRVLDVDDWNSETRELSFRSRPSTELRNPKNGQRTVTVPVPVADVLEFWLERERPDKTDDAGRAPLLATNRGRPSATSIRSWCYQATQPCVAATCPHDRSRETCEFTERSHASKCPSSRSPQAVRVGSIVWQLRRGVSVPLVAHRVGRDAKTVARYYWPDDLDEKPDHPEQVPDLLDGGDDGS